MKEYTDDYMHKVGDFKALCKVDDKHLVCKWCPLSISGNLLPQHLFEGTREINATSESEDDPYRVGYTYC